ncbi:hypothetical protein I6N90_10935 [Paenibacillus sp. GSMTC-2017]|uniref:WapI family immunity protein n=1 Tax=Paenibacillus sp. GSMTC-2017 TaxID=2794350 RepID=UPI0018D632FB|nr:hypothetical protein [Paenibacillus sp. GSMTC-2017]MBH5318323.1 hypothetical protein [Paenibacillus sp. GSMTC-2017]
MAQLVNLENNITFKINLLRNEFLDIVDEREDFENWIPFEMVLKVGLEKYEYLNSRGATFSLFEINKLISAVENIISVKLGATSTASFERVDFNSCEGFFGVSLYDTFEEQEVYTDIWINMGAISDGEIYGYDKGFRFVIRTESLSEFVNEIKGQLNELLEVE